MLARIIGVLFCTVIIFLLYTNEKRRNTYKTEFVVLNTSNVTYDVVKMKEDFQNRVERFIVGNNITLTTSRHPSKTKRKHPRKPDSNYQLNRLLYQLWDPNTHQNEHNMFTCDHLISEDRKMYNQAKRFAKKLNKKFYEYSKVTDLLEGIGPNCNNLRKLFRYQNPNFGPASYSIAFTITLETTAEQSLRMILSIYHHDNVYCLHPNARFGIKYYTLFRKISECIPNIIIPDRIFEIRIKTHNRLKAEMECFKKLTKTEHIPWKYGINLPSSAFPLYNNSILVHYLRSKPYEVQIDWKEPRDSHFIARFQYKHVIRVIEGGEHVIGRTSKRKPPPPHGIKIYRHGSWFIGTRNFYEVLSESLIAKHFLEWTRDTKNPEDFFYASLYKHLIDNRGVTYPNDLSTYIKQMKVRLVRPDHQVEDVAAEPESDLMISLWGSDKGTRCHGRYHGPRCIFGAADLKWLLQQPFLFANLFDFRVDRLIVDCLSKNLKMAIMKLT